MTLVCHTALKGDIISAYRVLMGRPVGKRALGSWEDNMTLGLQEVGCGGMDWIDMTQGRDRWRAIVNAVMNLPVS
jgi:hypothetical protein